MQSRESGWVGGVSCGRGRGLVLLESRGELGEGALESMVVPGWTYEDAGELVGAGWVGEMGAV